MKRLSIILFLTISINSFGQNNFKKEIDDTYNFYPHKLSVKEQKEKYPVLDKFFEMIKSDTIKFLPLLRQELLSNDHFPYFYYDCSHLLMILSKSHSDEEICAEAFSKCNIKDLNPKTYVSLLIHLSNNDINITKAAVKILEDSTFSFFVPEHALNFMQGYCLMYCLLPLDPNLYVDTLTNIFQKTKDIGAQKSIITTLWFAYSCLGDKFLQSINETNALTKEVVDYAKKLLISDELDRDYRKMLRKINLDGLEEMKKSALKRFSDEAIYDLDFVTKAKRKKLNCR